MVLSISTKNFNMKNIKYYLNSLLYFETTKEEVRSQIKFLHCEHKKKTSVTSKLSAMLGITQSVSFGLSLL